MIQFYLLAVLLNIITGIVLICTEENQNKEVIENTTLPDGNSDIFRNKTFLLVLGILTCFTGVIKLLSAIQGDAAIVGDLLPAAAALFGGVAILFDYYKMNSTTEIKLNDFFTKIFILGRKYLGFACIAIGILHFLFPRVLFL